MIDLVTFYSQNLAVPARRDVERPGCAAGKELFYAIGCISCHTPKFVTRATTPNKAQSFQLIWPYSDFLLHDMGDGLADGRRGRRHGHANGARRRSGASASPQTVNGHTFFLHDGRARNLTEAILWHGGEAQASRDKFANLSKEDRERLIAFVNSL